MKFTIIFNKLIENCETLAAVLEDTATLDAKIAATQEEVDTVVEPNKALIREHAVTGMEQEAFDRKAKEPDERFRKADARLNRLKGERQGRLMRACSVRKYVENLRRLAEHGEGERNQAECDYASPIEV